MGHSCGMRCVVKQIMIPPTKPERSNRFYQDIKACRLKSQHVVMVYDVLRSDMSLYVICEYARPLDKIIYSNVPTKAFAIETSVRYILQITEGMKYLHAQNITFGRGSYRPLRSSRVLVTGSGASETLKLNVALSMEQFAEQANNAISDDIERNLVWRSPNELMSSEKISKKSDDVWSFGILGYEIFTRKLPSVEGFMHNMHKHYTSQGQGMKLQLPDVYYPKPFVPLLKACCANNPDDRPTFEAIRKLILRSDWNKMAKQNPDVIIGLNAIP